MRFRFPHSLVALLFAASANAAETTLTLVHDSGATTPLAPLLEAAGLDPAAVADQGALPPVDPSPPRPMRFPSPSALVASPSLTPGVQARIAVGDAGKALPRPIFLVGADRLSLEWLTQHRQRLAALQAVGLVVQSASAQDLQRLRQAAAGLPLALGSGEMLAEHFALAHYPVLIGPQWIEQ
jgi:integrating conjugative element protein (TIGR03765 family)